MQIQLPLGDLVAQAAPRPSEHETSSAEPLLSSYDHVIVMFSGGKDGLACVLHLIERGVKPELWHHRVDGDPGEDPELRFDWPCTDDYVRKVAQALGLKLYYSWRDGGLSGELLKENARTRPAVFETPEGIARAGGVNGAVSTRRRFPQVSPDLRVRYCSGVAKIDVASAAIAGQSRFKGKRILVVTGERAQESAARARYAPFEPHRTHQPGPRAQRHVDHWRPVLHWKEAQVWDVIRRHRIVPHPCYRLGWSRASCLLCVFGSNSAWATIRQIDPERFGKVVTLEREFGCTIKRNVPISAAADAGVPFVMNPDDIRLAMSDTYDGEIIVSQWELPAGAYGESGGPT